MKLYELYKDLEKSNLIKNPLEAVLELLVYRYFGDVKIENEESILEALDRCKAAVSKKEQFIKLEFIKWNDIVKDSLALEAIQELLSSSELPSSLDEISQHIENMFEEIDTNRSRKKDAMLSAPMGLAKLVASVFKDKDISSIYDPTCGNGGLLAYMFKEHGSSSIYGSDINKSSTKIAILRLALLKCNKQEIVNKNSLDGVFFDKKELKKFDAVISIPPFSMPIDKEYIENDPLRIYKYGKAHRLRSEYSFISLVLHLLKNSGRGVVVVPIGVLSRITHDGVIRKALLKENIIDSVIWLPTNIFAATQTPCAVVVFDKSRVNSEKDVLLVDARELYRKGRVVNIIMQSDLEKISKVLKNREKSEISITISASKILEDGGIISLEYIQKSNENSTKQTKHLRPSDELRSEFFKIDRDIERLLSD